MKELALNLLVIFLASSCEGSVQNVQQKVQQLEKQFLDLEALVIKLLEQDLVPRYGMKRRCAMPEVDHGNVECDSQDIIPGTQCTATCAPGYTSSSAVTCADDGMSWSGQLRCDVEKSLVVISGGSDSSASVEVINLHNSTGCHLDIPDIPLLTPHKEIRLMHNMFYIPGNPFTLLACNGLTAANKASCDSWSPGDLTWKFHSNPHHKLQPHKWVGRYGAASFAWDGSLYTVGGMISRNIDHHPTDGTVRFRGNWEPVGSFKLKTKRSLFCVTNFNITDFAAVGGFSGKLEKSVELLGKSGSHAFSIPDMRTSRNGHSCVGISGDAPKILMSGGSKRSHRSGAKALKSSEMYSSDTNRWERVGDMVYTRFGHALVNIGGRIVAIGGKEWNPDVPLKNAEEFDVTTKTWRSLGDVLSIPRANFGYVLVPHSDIPGCTMH